MIAEKQMLTVIIPTRERPETLRYALETAFSQENPDIEILVSDNFSGPEVKAVVDACNDKRLRYIRTKERMGMSEHWDFALEHATGDWVAIIGDDDGLLPGAVNRFLDLVKKNPDIKAITSAACKFHWPSEGQNDGKLSLVSGKGYEIRNGLDIIKRTMRGEIIAMPTIYTGGFVHKDVINAIKQKNPNGKFFQSMLPDIYSGMAICSVVDKYIYSWKSFAIAGAAKNSNCRQHKGKQKTEMEKLDFHKENGIAFHDSLNGSAVESMQIVLYESFLQTRNLRSDNFGVTLEQQLEVALTHAVKRVWDEVYKYCKIVAEKNDLDLEKIVRRAEENKKKYKIKKLSNKIKRRVLGLGKLPKKNIKDNNVRTIYDASKKLGELIS